MFSLFAECRLKAKSGEATLPFSAFDFTTSTPTTDDIGNRAIRTAANILITNIFLSIFCPQLLNMLRQYINISKNR